MPSLGELATIEPAAIVEAIGHRGKAERIAAVVRGVAALGETFLSTAPYAAAKDALLSGAGNRSVLGCCDPARARSGRQAAIVRDVRARGPADLQRSRRIGCDRASYRDQIGYWSFYLKTWATRSRASARSTPTAAAAISGSIAYGRTPSSPSVLIGATSQFSQYTPPRPSSCGAGRAPDRHRGALLDRLEAADPASALDRPASSPRGRSGARDRSRGSRRDAARTRRCRHVGNADPEPRRRTGCSRSSTGRRRPSCRTAGARSPGLRSRTPSERGRATTARRRVHREPVAAPAGAARTTGSARRDSPRAVTRARASHARQRRGHDARIVDQQLQRAIANPRSERVDRGRRAEVELVDRDVREPVKRGARLRAITRGHDHIGHRRRRARVWSRGRCRRNRRSRSR